MSLIEELRDLYPELSPEELNRFNEIASSANRDGFCQDTMEKTSFERRNNSLKNINSSSDESENGEKVFEQCKLF